jgi:hypothetical protein
MFRFATPEVSVIVLVVARVSCFLVDARSCTDRFFFFQCWTRRSGIRARYIPNQTVKSFIMNTYTPVGRCGTPRIQMLSEIGVRSAVSTPVSNILISSSFSLHALLYFFISKIVFCEIILSNRVLNHNHSFQLNSPSTARLKKRNNNDVVLRTTRVRRLIGRLRKRTRLPGIAK